MTNLQAVVLPNQVNDAGLLRHKGMTGLQTLNFNLSETTEASVADLKKALPNCKIFK
jgi:hypothetical protein